MTVGNIMDYLEWRGDLSFASAGFCEADNLILSELAYLDLSGIVGEKPVPLAQVAQAFFEQGRDKAVEESALIMAQQLSPLLWQAAQSPRFAAVQLCHFIRKVDFEKEIQFQAVTFHLGQPGLYLAFCGTDDTLVGWKEDFKMCFLQAVPAQCLAQEYLARVAAQWPGTPLRLGGHSKGGNLAVWAAIHAEPAHRAPITAVYSNDGPGFRDDLTQMESYRELKDRIHTFLPQSSVVGLLLEHDEDFEVIRSHQKGILQHDGFSWELRRDSFVRLGEVSLGMQARDLALKNFIKELSIEQREQFTDAIFEILSSGGTRTTTELRAEGLKALPNMKKTYDSLDEDTRRAVNRTVALLLSQSIKSWAELLSEEAFWSEWQLNLEQVWNRLLERPRRRSREESEALILKK